jgi:conjugal transfer/entry exclusion protein
MKSLIKNKIMTFITVFFLTFTAFNLTINVKPANALFGVGDIVFDPATWLESMMDFLETAAQTIQNEIDAAQQTIQSYEAVTQTVEMITQTANQLKQISNQVESLRNQGTQIYNQVESIARYDEMLEEWYKDLMKLEDGDFFDMVDRMGHDLDQIADMLSDNRGYVRDYESVKENYDETFDTFSEEGALSPEEITAKNGEWNEILLKTSFDSTKSAEILANNEADVEQVANAMGQIQAAEGTVGVLQGMAGLDVIQARQAAEMRYLMVTMNQQLGVQAAVEASDREQGRRDVSRFYEEAKEFTEVGGVSLEEMGATGYR